MFCSIDVYVVFMCMVFFLLSNRCAFVSNLSKDAEVPSLVPTQKKMKALLKKDLVMNVYRDGQWGVFRHQLLTQGKKRKSYKTFSDILTDLSLIG